MGRRIRGHKSKGGGKKGGRGRGRGQGDQWRISEDVPKDNALFRKYYVTQGIVTEAEMEDLIATFRLPLPTNFRISPVAANREVILDKLRNYFQRDPTEGDAEVKEPPPKPYPLRWYPNELAWETTVARQQIRKVSGLKEFHQWLVHETEVGNITRQEAVSMIPPLLLNVEPHHRVLDMCASPGSKTTQMLEAMLAQQPEGVLPTGVLVANDLNPKRSYMLAHQCRRLTPSCLLVTCHDGRQLPDPTRDALLAGLHLSRDEIGFYDRVLADVPCSGDGTFRKNLDLWLNWSIESGLGLHSVQLQIASRGAQLLRRDGLMVYSTCSLNPVEDEAVVASLLRWGRGALEVVDTAHMLPGLPRRAGVSRWKALSRTMHEWRDMEDVVDFIDRVDAQRSEKRRAHLEKIAAAGGGEGEGGEDEREAKDSDGLPEEPPEDREEYLNWLVRVQGRKAGQHLRHLRGLHAGIFPPTEEEAEWMHLDRCMRILPQDNNSGGFFVCLLRKTAELPGKCADVSTAGDKFEQRRKARRDAARAAAGAGAGGEEEARDDDPEEEDGGEEEKGEKEEVAAEAQEEEGEEEEEEEEEGGDQEPPSKRARVEGGATGLSPLPSLPLRFGSIVPSKWIDPTRQAFLQQLPASVFEKVRAIFGLPDDFPKEQLFVRNGNMGQIVFVSPDLAHLVLRPAELSAIRSVRTFVAKHREQGIDPLEKGDVGIRLRLKPVVGGVRMFEYRAPGKGIMSPDPQEGAEEVDQDTISDHPAAFRPILEGSWILAQYATKRKVSVSLDEFAALIARTGQLRPIASFSTHLSAAIEAEEAGGLLMQVDLSMPLDDGRVLEAAELGPRPEQLARQLVLPVWKGRTHINVMCSKSERKELISLLRERGLTMLRMEPEAEEKKGEEEEEKGEKEGEEEAMEDAEEGETAAGGGGAE